MSDPGWLAERFEEHRRHLRNVARRILGSHGEADDALQEAWLRVSRASTESVENLGGWLTTTVARVCLDMLRSRRSRHETVEANARKPDVFEDSKNPESQLQLADSMGPALVILLETLEPAERVAFVLHDVFDVPFDDIARIVGRSSEATRQLASRARRRIQGDKATPQVDLQRHREVVRAFLSASRDGNFEALLGILDPEVVLRADEIAVSTAAAAKWGGVAELSRETHGATAVAAMLDKRTSGVRPALIGGDAGAVWTHAGQPRGAWLFSFDSDRIVGLELVLDPTRIAQLEIAVDD